MIVVDSTISFTRLDYLFVEHKHLDSKLICILNRECAILSPGNNVAAILDEAVAKTI